MVPGIFNGFNFRTFQLINPFIYVGQRLGARRPEIRATCYVGYFFQGRLIDLCQDQTAVPITGIGTAEYRVIDRYGGSPFFSHTYGIYFDIERFGCPGCGDWIYRPCVIDTVGE